MYLNYLNLTYLKILILSPPSPTDGRSCGALLRSFKDKRTNVSYSSVSFATLSLPCFNYFKNLFYNSDELKIVPSNIKVLLTRRGLAYWIMDDSSLLRQKIKVSPPPCYRNTFRYLWFFSSGKHRYFSFKVCFVRVRCPVGRKRDNQNIFVR